jgi:hypothetical protein
MSSYEDSNNNYNNNYDNNNYDDQLSHDLQINFNNIYNIYSNFQHDYETIYNNLDDINPQQKNELLANANLKLLQAQEQLYLARKNVSNILLNKYKNFDNFPYKYKKYFVPPSTGIKRPLI